MGEPLTPEEEAEFRRVHFHVMGHGDGREPVPCGSCRLLATLDAERARHEDTQDVLVQTDIELTALRDRHAALVEAAQAVATWEGNAWRRDGEDVATIGLADLDRLADRIAALRAALDGEPS